MLGSIYIISNSINNNVDKATIKHVLEVNNISIRNTRTYKLSKYDR